MTEEDGRSAAAAVPRPVRLLILSLVPNNLAFGYFMVYVTAFLPSVGYSAGTVGGLVGIQGAVLVLGGIPIGILSDRRQRKPFFLLGILAAAPMMLLVALTRDVALYYLAAVVGGLSEACVLSSWNAMIADQTNLENRDTAFSLSFVSSNVSLALGFTLPLAFPAIQAATGLESRTVHVDALVVLAVSVLVGFGVTWSQLRGYQDASRVPRPRGGIRPLLKFSGFNALIGLGAGFIIPLIPTWLFLRFGFPDTISGPLLAVSNVTMGLAAVVSPRLSRRFGLMDSIIMTAGSSTFLMFTLALIPNAALASGVYIVRSALMNMNAPLMDSFLMGITPVENRGFASAVSSIIWRLPNSASTIAGGAMLAAGIYDLPFYLATCLYAAGLSLIYLNFRHVKPTS